MNRQSAGPGDAAADLASIRLRHLAGHAGLVVAIVLLLAKVAAWLASDSLSMLAAVIDALVDLFASLVTVLGVRFALRPADAMHRFGHGKAESLAALIQALLLAGAACVLVFDGLYRMINPPPLARLDFGLGVMVGSIVLTVVLILFESHAIRRTRSQAIAADRLHRLSDVAANLAVLGALALTEYTGWLRIDPLFALGIAILFGGTAWKIARFATDTLMDRELSRAEREQITQIVLAHPGARGLHDLRTRTSGLLRFIELHLELDGNLSVHQAHAMADEIERALVEAIPRSQVIVHVEPAGIDDERLDDRIEPGRAGAPARAAAPGPDRGEA